MTPSEPPAELLRRLAEAVEAQAVELAELRRLVARLAPCLPPTQRALVEALAVEFGESPFASREVLAAARSPLSAHDPLRRALAAVGATGSAERIGRALRSLSTATAGTAPRLIRCKAERGAAVWAVAGIDPA